MDLDNYIEENKSNISIEEIVKKFNLSVPTVYRHLRMHNVKPRKDKQNSRKKEIMKLRDSGMTYAEIGKHYNVSRQRIEQIIHE